MWSYEAFLAEGELLVARSQQTFGEEGAAVWEWRHGRRAHLLGNSFLVSRDNTRMRKRRKEKTDGADGGGVANSDDLEDINALLQEDLDDDDHFTDSSVLAAPPDDADDDETVLYEFHIVFHAVYQTPVLYFRLSRLDGSPVAFDTSAAREVQLPGGNARAALVAMDDHQVLGTPFYLLHPCETASAMALLLDQPRLSHSHPQSSPPTWPLGASSVGRPSYLLAWLSLVQPLTRINPLMY